MHRLRVFTLFFALLLFGLLAPALAAKRVALVIGNADYEHTQRLANPENDSRLIASILRRQGFEVLEHRNLGYKAMKRAIRAYTSKLTNYGKDTVGLIYFAGHGLQASARNFLLPVDARIEKEGDIQIEAISSQDLLSGVQYAGNRLNVIILDACRNNPYRGTFRSASRGLARMDAPVGSLLAFSTAPGTVAADGDGAHSPYTAALADAMVQPGLKIEEVFKRVRAKVYDKTGGRQVPWESSSIFGNFYFETQPSGSPPRQTSNQKPTSRDPAREAWGAISGTSSKAILGAFIAKFPNSLYADFARARIREIDKQQTALIVPPKKPSGGLKPTPAVGIFPKGLKRGGTLNFVVGSKIPSFDGHIEGTFGMVHPIRPFYSLLIRINPDNPSSPSDFVCDLCEGDVPTGENGGTTYRFRIRRDVAFHDGTPLTAHDIVATYRKIIFPPSGIPSARKAFYGMVDSVRASDNYTVVFRLKYPSGAFVPALASPFNFVYAKKDLDRHGYRWHKRNINGTGPFVFVQHKPGSFVEGKKYRNYHFKGRPYLDGFKAISAPKMSVRLQAIRGDRAGIEFRGFPPKARDDLKRALGSRITSQESDWNCVFLFTPNQRKKPFKDRRVRRALSLAIDRWGGSRYLPRIAIVKSVGGIVFPGHELAPSQRELQQLAGYSTNIAANRREARRLLKEAGYAGLSFTLSNRGVDQPYKVVGTWLVDQWRKIGLKVKQEVNSSPVFYNKLRRNKDFDVSIDFNCQSVVNPIADVSKYLGSAGNNYGSYRDPTLEAIFDRLWRADTITEQRRLIREYEKRAIDEMAHMSVVFWWHRIVAHRSYVKGWKMAPSHYLNQHLDNVWLDK